MKSFLQFMVPIVIVWTVVMGAFTAMLLTFGLPNPNVINAVPVAPTVPVLRYVPKDYSCEEDMPCWDCSTMGNRICGLELDR